MATMTFKEFRDIKFNTPPWDHAYNPLGFRAPVPGMSDISAHLPFIEYMAYQCDHCTEFGTRDCYSTAALISGCKGKVVSYDLDISNTVRQLAALDLPCDWNFGQADTIAPGFEINETDLLFIDTLHTYGQVRDELSHHAYKVNKYIIFHDTYSHGVRSLDIPGEEGILKAINEFLASNLEWENVYEVQFNHGLIMIERHT
jgi:hypothetical protein